MNHNFKEGQLVVAIADCPNGHYKKGHAGSVFSVWQSADYQEPVDYDHLLIQWDHNYDIIGVHYQDIALKEEYLFKVGERVVLIYQDGWDIAEEGDAGYIAEVDDEDPEMFFVCFDIKRELHETSTTGKTTVLGEWIESRQLVFEKDFKEVSSTPETESKLTQLREDMGNVGIPYKAGKYIIALEDEINRLRIEVAELKSTIREQQRNTK